MSARGRSIDFQSDSGGAQEGNAPRPGSAVCPSSPSSPHGASQELWLTACTWLPLKFLPAIQTEQLVLKLTPGKVASLGTATCVSSAPPLSFPSDNSCFSAWSKVLQMLEDKLIASFGVILAWIFLFHFFKSFPARRPYLHLGDSASWPVELQFHV